jgi:hypothetical protein
VEDHDAYPLLMNAVSSDGIFWGAPFVSAGGVSTGAAGALPMYTHNVGVSGDARGYLVTSGTTLVGFGTPKGLAQSISWASWDVYVASYGISRQ